MHVRTYVPTFVYRISPVFFKMSLLRYLKPIDGLPDPKGYLSTTMSREDITAANQEVQKELNATKKRGQYKKYTPAQ